MGQSACVEEGTNGFFSVGEPIIFTEYALKFPDCRAGHLFDQKISTDFSTDL